MKRNNIFKVFAVMALLATGLTSCNDFLTIYPTDKTIGEDFWKTKQDVQNMVTGAYGSIISYGCQEKAIVWGGFRSDELVKYSSCINTSLDNINAVNLLPTNSYSEWGSFYGVINRCNIVLNHAADVMELDPSFTQGDYNEVRAQMLALRSLCYFYLVRTFRDVPYTTQSYEDDDQEMSIPQSAPDSVLQCCIADLEESERYIMHSGAYGQGSWKNVGYFTRDAVWALLADIYLWRASMNHSQADYQKCIEYADKVIESKDAYYKDTHGAAIASLGNDPYHLLDRDNYVFITGRKKNVIIASNGKNVFPEELEGYLLGLPIVDECMVWGGELDPNSPFNGIHATVRLNKEELERKLGADYTPEQAEALLDEAVDKINDSMPRFKRIAHVIIREREFDKTTTQKIRRFVEDNKRA